MNEISQFDLSSVEYIWIDGGKFSTQIRTKTRLMSLPDDPDIHDFSRWSFDGRSAFQSPCDEAYLMPVRCYPNPLKSGHHYLLLCEVVDAQGVALANNYRAGLKQMMHKYEPGNLLWLGFEQAFFIQDSTVDSPEVQAMAASLGAYSEGGDSPLLRGMVEQHAQACLQAGLALASCHAGSTPGQWVFQLGYRGLDENLDALRMADDLWLARYLLEYLVALTGRAVHYDVAADQNPLATGISTWRTRNPRFGLDEIQQLISVLEGLETVDRSSQEFKQQFYRSDDYAPGYTSRETAIRVPLQVAQQRCGYFVDRRPRGHADPYRIAQYILGALITADAESDINSTLCGGRDDVNVFEMDSIN